MFLCLFTLKFSIILSIFVECGIVMTLFLRPSLNKLHIKYRRRRKK